MLEMTFWGERGEYGPFTTQEDGWPNAGEVIRHYRRNLKMSAEELARRYGEVVGARITARWILKMEQQNKVPADITRRRILIRLLGIPPILLGLASLGQVAPHSGVETKAPNIPVLLKNAPALDLLQYDRSARAYWLLSYAGEESLEEIVRNIQELEKVERQSRGDLLKNVWMILNSHYQLASDITRHQGNFSAAWFYANNAVRVAKRIDMNDVLAAALYRRGYIYLEWAIFGNNVLLAMMNHTPDREKVRSAVVDLEAALPHARPQLKGAIWLELSRAQGIMKNISVSVSLTNRAADMVEAGSAITDPVEQILLEGALNGLNEGMYLLGKAASLLIMGRTTTALEILDDLDELKNGRGIASNQTRRLAYANILRAEAALGEKDYLTSAIRAISAFKTFRDIHTVERIAWVNDIHGRLVEKYGNRSEIKELGKMLAEYKKANVLPG